MRLGSDAGEAIEADGPPVVAAITCAEDGPGFAAFDVLEDATALGVLEDATALGVLEDEAALGLVEEATALGVAES